MMYVTIIKKSLFSIYLKVTRTPEGIHSFYSFLSNMVAKGNKIQKNDTLVSYTFHFYV